MLPSLLQRMDKAHPYQGVPMLGPDAEVYYAARVQEVYDGFGSLGNTFYSAPKDQPYLQPPLPEYTIASVGRILHVRAITAFFLSKFVLAVTVFLALAAFLFSVTGRPWVSVLSTTAVMMAGALLCAPWDIMHFLMPGSYDFEFLRFARAVNPQWSGTWFFLALYALSEWIKGHKKTHLVVSAVCTGILVYSYVYAWTFLAATFGLLGLWYACKRDWKHLSGVALCIGIVAVIAVPYVLHMLVVTQNPLYPESAQRLGLVLRHGPVMVGVWLAVLIAVGFLSKNVWPTSWPLVLAVGIAGFVALNQHVITGQYIVPQHYHWYFIQPLASAFAVALVLSLGSSYVLNDSVKTVFGAFLIAVAVLCATIQQWGAYRGLGSMWGQLQQAGPVLEAAHLELRPGQVAYSQDIDILNVLPTLSGVDMYFAGNAGLALGSTERARDTYFFDLWLRGVRADQAAKEFPTTRRFELSSRLHDIYYRESAGDFRAIPDAEVEAASEAYREYMKLTLRDKLTKYPLHVVVTTPRDVQSPAWKTFLKCTRTTFAEQGYELRALIPAGQRGSCI